jgi:hypothetical protein
VTAHSKVPNRFIPQPVVFVLEIAGRPTLAFEATSAREAKELVREQWLLDDLINHRTNGIPVWDGKAKLRTGVAIGEQLAEVRELLQGAADQDLPIVYLVPIDAA